MCAYVRSQHSDPFVFGYADTPYCEDSRNTDHRRWPPYSPNILFPAERITKNDIKTKPFNDFNKHIVLTINKPELLLVHLISTEFSSACTKKNQCIALD